MRAAVAIRVNVFFISYLPFIVVKPNWLVTVHLSFFVNLFAEQTKRRQNWFRVFHPHQQRVKGEKSLEISLPAARNSIVPPN